MLQSRQLLECGKMQGHPHVVTFNVVYDMGKSMYFFKKPDGERIYVTDMSARAEASDMAGTFTIVQRESGSKPTVSFYFSDDQAACLFKLGY